MKINEAAWDSLNEDERLSLNLAFIQDKSTWESGELMGKSHYKYLEIKYRATHLLKIFTQHFEMYEKLIPDGVRCSDELRRYFHLTIEKRTKVKESQEIINKEFGFTSKKNFEKEIAAWVKKHSASESLIVLNFVNLVKEFDRWNNFRILPEEVQEPSAYKRRNKKRHRNYIKITTQLKPISVDIIKKTFTSRIGTGSFICIVPEGREIIIFNARVNQLENITETGFYLWADKEMAKKYGELIQNYIIKEKKHCLDGLNFWPEYREIVVKALNYNEIQKIYPSRRFLEMAMTKLEFYGRDNKKKKKVATE